VEAFHERIDALLMAAIGGGEAGPREVGPAYLRLGAMLQHVWFSALVSWASGVQTPEGIVEAVVDAAALVLEPPGLG
jgi:hypothetical protein